MSRWRLVLCAGMLIASGGNAGAAGHRKHAAKPPPPAPRTAENLVVHGQKRFQPAPMPNQEIHDPADALRDPNTGAPVGKFGGAFLDANPVPAINPGSTGDQSPVDVGVQR